MSTTVKVKENDYWFRKKLEDIIDNNCKEIPYEGTEIDKSNIVSEIMSLINTKEYSLLNHQKI